MEQVCSTVVILDKGRVAVSGTVDEVTRAAAVRRRAALRVPVEQVDRAQRAIAEVPGMSAEVTVEGPDMLTVSLSGAPGDLNAALLAVLAADVPVLRFDVDAARLSDAFLALTREGVG